MMWIVFLLLGSLSGEAFDSAEGHYRKGEYEQAKTRFLEAIEAELAPRGVLLYNVGNCCYRLEQKAEALAYYLDARRELPRDEALSFQIRLVRDELDVRRDRERAFFSTLSRLSRSDLLVAAFGLQVLGLIGWLFLTRASVWRSIMPWLIALGLVLGVLLVMREWSPRSQAVVLDSEVIVREEPHPNAISLQTLSKGMEVRVIAASKRWTHIATDQEQGWAPSSALSGRLRGIESLSTH